MDSSWILVIVPPLLTTIAPVRSSLIPRPIQKIGEKGQISTVRPGTTPWVRLGKRPEQSWFGILWSGITHTHTHTHRHTSFTSPLQWPEVRCVSLLFCCLLSLPTSLSALSMDGEGSGKLVEDGQPWWDASENLANIVVDCEGFALDSHRS